MRSESFSNRSAWLLAAVVAVAAVAGAFPAGAAPAWAAGDLFPAPIGDNPAGGAIASHRLTATIDPATASLVVADTLTIVHRPGIPRSVQFPVLLARSLKLTRVTGLDLPMVIHEERLRPRDYWHSPPYEELGGYERARSIFLAPSGAPADWPEEVRVVFIYEGVVCDSLRPPEAAYARGFETTSGLVDPRGAFLSGASFWVPSRPDERFTFRCTLRTPIGWRGVSQGKSLFSGIRTFMHRDDWICAQPMEEIYFIAGPYVGRKEEYRGVLVQTFTYANTDSATCSRYIEGTKRYLDLYGERIGPYPFEKFALVENFWQTGFGMPSFTLLGDQVIRLPFILDTSYGHEILHNWWGNGVFVDYARGNWCEGLTTYGADYLYKERQSEAEARDYRRTTLQGYLDYVSEKEDAPLRLFRERGDFATQAIGYGKSMMVVHQIRRLLGDGEFWGALQEFYRAQLFKRASWDDLFDAFAKRSGMNLSGWKEQWLERTGAPVLILKEREVSGSNDAGYAVTVVIGQEQRDLYDLRVPVRIGWEDPLAESTRVVPLSERTAACTFSVKRPPDWVAVDPDFDVLRKIDASEIPPAISRTLGADTAVVVIADGLTPEATAAYEVLANDWDTGAKLGILREAGLPAVFAPGVPLWLLGRGPLAGRLLASMSEEGCVPPAGSASGWIIAGSEQPAGRDAVIAGGTPAQPWTLVDVAAADGIATVGRKIPHYGKYSYLLFEGGKNVVKGSWDVRSSPLRATFAGGAK